MKAVNLIPVEDRSGERRKARTGPGVYVVLGVLGAVLLATTLYVTTGNTIAEREAQGKRLKSEEQELLARSASLQAFASFRELHDARTQTVRSLAESRFDWERVMRELALVLPGDVWLTELAASVADGADGGGAESELRKEVLGPALVLEGCGRSHRSVADFLTRLRNIDGVTRVMAEKSERPGAGDQSRPTTGDTDCRTRDSFTKFVVVAGFDGITVDPAAAAQAAPDPSDPAAVQERVQDARRSAAGDAAEKTEKATDLLPGR